MASELGGHHDVVGQVGFGQPTHSQPPPSQPSYRVYKLTCSNCSAALQVVLPQGVFAFQCCNCKAVFVLQSPDSINLSGKAIGKKKRRRRDKAEPERPRREPTQYNLFLKETLAAVKRDNPDLTHREAFRIASGKVGQLRARLILFLVLSK
mmetsp:Transcript_45639/g.117959  ORF Transcript_45639/g.117959 Transcript_45639/m.117959 type:complete len:151 (-) Transcript_45639:527-979(-)